MKSATDYVCRTEPKLPYHLPRTNKFHYLRYDRYPMSISLTLEMIG